MRASNSVTADRPPIPSSSKPSSAWTRTACLLPSRSRACASLSAIAAWPTPISWCSRPGRVRQRPEDVEDRANADLAPGRPDEAHRRVKGRRVHEADADLVDTARHRSGVSSIATPSPSSTSAEPHFEVIARLPCLATRTPAAGDDERRGGRDVERAGRVAAGAAGIDERADRPAIELDPQGVLPHRPGEAGDLLDCLAPHSQRGDQGADLGTGGAAGHDLRPSPPPPRRPTARRPRPRCGSRSLNDQASRCPGSPSSCPPVTRRPRPRAPAAGRRRAATQEIRKQIVPGRGQDRLRVELDALDRELAVAQAHDEAVGLGGDLQRRGRVERSTISEW